MTELREQVARALARRHYERMGGAPKTEWLEQTIDKSWRGWAGEASVVLDAIEPAIRADERAKVRAEATSDEAGERAWDAFCDHPTTRGIPSMIAAIRAALGEET